MCRRQCAFQTKPEIALALVDQARAWAVPFALVVADAGYGDNPNFLEGLDARQIPYVCGVESTFGVRLPERSPPLAATPPPYQGRGQPKKPRPAPLYTAQELTDALPPEAWQTLTWRERGPNAGPSEQTGCGAAGALGHGQPPPQHEPQPGAHRPRRVAGRRAASARRDGRQEMVLCHAAGRDTRGCA